MKNDLTIKKTEKNIKETTGKGRFKPAHFVKTGTGNLN